MSSAEFFRVPKLLIYNRKKLPLFCGIVEEAAQTVERKRKGQEKRTEQIRKK